MPPKKVSASKPVPKLAAKKAGGKKGESGKAEAKGAAAAAPSLPPPITSIGLKAIPGVVEKSCGGGNDAEKWPLIIDLQGNVGTFFKYRNTCYIQAELPGEMVPDKLRLALLGALRFGKHLVVDFGEDDVNNIQLLDEVQMGLTESLLSRALLEKESFMNLVQPSDEKDYQPNNHYMIETFAFVVVTKNPGPNPSVANKFTCFRVE